MAYSPAPANAQKTGSGGFTLLELMIVMSIASLLVAGGVASFNNYNNGQKVRQAALTLRNNLRLAQTKAISAEKPPDSTGCDELNGYYVSFPSSSAYSIGRRCDTNEDTVIQTVTLPTPVVFSPVPATILFEVLTTGTNLGAAQTLTLTGFGLTAPVVVYPSGDIKYP